jgi:hypothetical protein
MRRVILRMMRYQEAAAQDHTKPRLRRLPAASSAPLDTDPLVVQWARRFERMIIAAERDAENFELRDRFRDESKLDTHYSRAEARPRLSAMDQRTRKRILARENVGMDPTWIAFWEGRTTRSIRELRAQHGLDPDSGVRRDKPLTDLTPRSLPNLPS